MSYFFAPTCMLTLVRPLIRSTNKTKVYKLFVPFLYEHTFGARMTFCNTVYAFMY